MLVFGLQVSGELPEQRQGQHEDARREEQPADEGEGRDPEDRTRQICNGWRADDVIAAQVLSERTGRAGAGGQHLARLDRDVELLAVAERALPADLIDRAPRPDAGGDPKDHREDREQDRDLPRVAELLLDEALPRRPGEGCRTCRYSGWLEMGGSGVVDPRVFENVGVDPEEWSGFAFGCGLGAAAPDGATIEQWENVPAVSAGLPALNSLA